MNASSPASNEALRSITGDDIPSMEPCACGGGLGSPAIALPAADDRGFLLGMSGIC